MKIILGLLLVFHQSGLLYGQPPPPRHVESCIQTNYTLTSTQSAGVLIESLNYPDKPYSNFAHLCWLFTVDAGNLSIVFKDVNIELSYDRVMVYEGPARDRSAVITQATGNLFGPTVPAQSTTSVILVTFTSDYSVTAAGFQACICPADAGCTCNYHDTSDMWDSWRNRDHENDESYYAYSDYSMGLSRSAKAGIGIGVFLLITIPVIIGVTVSCCMKRKGKDCLHVTQDPQSQRETSRREHGGVTNLTFGPPISTVSATTFNTEVTKDRKHNDVRPFVASQPPVYTTYSDPPQYNTPSYLLLQPITPAVKRDQLPPLESHGTLPPITGHSPDVLNAMFGTQAGVTPLADIPVAKPQAEVSEKMELPDCK